MGRTTRRGVVLAAVVAGLALVLTAGCTPPLGRVATLQRPNVPRVFDAADPAVLIERGRTYVFASTNFRKLPVREVTSLRETLASSQQAWHANPIEGMPTRPAWVDPTESDIWAPSAVRIEGKFWVYFAAARGGAISNEHNDKCIGRAVADTPLGPYRPESVPIYCGLPAEGAVAGQPASNWWGRSALDPEVVRDRKGGFHMLVALGRSRDNIGHLRLDRAGRVVGGVNARPDILAGQQFNWHDGKLDSTMTGHAFLENPSMIYDPQTDTYLLFYSAGEWYSSRYVTGFARCTSPAGPCRLDSRNPFLMSGNGRTGPGGLTVFRDAAGVTKVAYATWQQGFENQVGPSAIYKRHTHWATLVLSATSDPAAQSVSLR